MHYTNWAGVSPVSIHKKRVIIKTKMDNRLNKLDESASGKVRAKSLYEVLLIASGARCRKWQTTKSPKVLISRNFAA